MDSEFEGGPEEEETVSTGSTSNMYNESGQVKDKGAAELLAYEEENLRKNNIETERLNNQAVLEGLREEFPNTVCKFINEETKEEVYIITSIGEVPRTVRNGGHPGYDSYENLKAKYGQFQGDSFCSDIFRATLDDTVRKPAVVLTKDAVLCNGVTKRLSEVFSSDNTKGEPANNLSHLRNVLRHIELSHTVHNESFGNMTPKFESAEAPKLPKTLEEIQQEGQDYLIAREQAIAARVERGYSDEERANLELAEELYQKYPGAIYKVEEFDGEPTYHIAPVGYVIKTSRDTYNELLLEIDARPLSNPLLQEIAKRILTSNKEQNVNDTVITLTKDGFGQMEGYQSEQKLSPSIIEEDYRMTTILSFVGRARAAAINYGFMKPWDGGKNK